MRPQDSSLAQRLSQKLVLFDEEITPLPGLINTGHLNCLVLQLIDSIRRINYIQVIKNKPLSDIYINPQKPYFDPIKAAAWAAQNNMIDEAFWLVFLSVHFGKNRKSGWSLARAVYAGSAGNGNWNWQNISNNFLKFQKWLDSDISRLHKVGSFGNHRKYQSLDAYSSTGTGNAIGSYIEWVVTGHGNHQSLIQAAINETGKNPRELFDYLYKSMSDVVSFGRTAKFDYLTMIGKFELAAIEPGFTYLQDATGPKRGARLLFGGSIKSNIKDNDLNLLISSLDSYLGLYFGMQVLEDALCNWQKNPNAFEHFSG